MCGESREEMERMELSHDEMHQRGIPHEHSGGHVHSHQHTRAVVNRLARAIGAMLVAVAGGEHRIAVKRIRGTGIHSRIQEAIRMGAADRA